MYNSVYYDSPMSYCFSKKFLLRLIVKDRDPEGPGTAGDPGLAYD